MNFKHSNQHIHFNQYHQDPNIRTKFLTSQYFYDGHNPIFFKASYPNLGKVNGVEVVSSSLKYKKESTTSTISNFEYLNDGNIYSELSFNLGGSVDAKADVSFAVVQLHLAFKNKAKTTIATKTYSGTIYELDEKFMLKKPTKIKINRAQLASQYNRALKYSDAGESQKIVLDLSDDGVFWSNKASPFLRHLAFSSAKVNGNSVNVSISDDNTMVVESLHGSGLPITFKTSDRTKIPIEISLNDPTGKEFGLTKFEIEPYDFYNADAIKDISSGSKLNSAFVMAAGNDASLNKVRLVFDSSWDLWTSTVANVVKSLDVKPTGKTKVTIPNAEMKVINYGKGTGPYYLEFSYNKIFDNSLVDHDVELVLKPNTTAVKFLKSSDDVSFVSSIKKEKIYHFPTFPKAQHTELTLTKQKLAVEDNSYTLMMKPQFSTGMNVTELQMSKVDVSNVKVTAVKMKGVRSHKYADHDICFGFTVVQKNTSDASYDAIVNLQHGDITTKVKVDDILYNSKVYKMPAFTKYMPGNYDGSNVLQVGKPASASYPIDLSATGIWWGDTVPANIVHEISYNLKGSAKQHKLALENIQITQHHTNIPNIRIHNDLSVNEYKDVEVRFKLKDPFGVPGAVQTVTMVSGDILPKASSYRIKNNDSLAADFSLVVTNTKTGIFVNKGSSKTKNSLQLVFDDDIVNKKAGKGLFWVEGYPKTAFVTTSSDNKIAEVTGIDISADFQNMDHHFELLLPKTSTKVGVSDVSYTFTVPKERIFTFPDLKPTASDSTHLRVQNISYASIASNGISNSADVSVNVDVIAGDASGITMASSPFDADEFKNKFDISSIDISSASVKHHIKRGAKLILKSKDVDEFDLSFMYQFQNKANYDISYTFRHGYMEYTNKVTPFIESDKL